jgi:methylthioribulose-1-phosphate dehydratase
MSNPTPEFKTVTASADYLIYCIHSSVFFSARQAGAVIHTHSKAAVMATLLYPGKEFRVTHLEMIKVILGECMFQMFCQ